MSNDEVTRIGRGVPTSAPAPAQPQRRTTVLLVAGGMFVGLGLAVVLVFGGSIFGASKAGQPPAQVPMPAASTQNHKVLDEQATCVLLIPVAKDGTDLVTSVITDPNKADWAKVQKTHDDLKLIADIAAPELRDDINQQAAMLATLLSLSRTGGKLTIDTVDYKASGLRIGARCYKYAS